MTIVEARRAAYTEPDFRARVEFFVVKAAVAVTAENPVTALHAERQALAEQILASPESHVTRFALAAMTNATLLAAVSHSAITDNDLEFTVNSVYDAMVDRP